MIRFLLSTLLMLFFISFSFGQNLRPNESILTMPEYEFNYYLKIRNKLLKDNYKDTKLKLIVLPSFKPEYTFRIIRSENEYYGVVTIADENIWYSKDIENLKINEFTSLIKNEYAELILNNLNEILSKTQYTEILNFTTDGIRFIISNNDKSGTFRSGDNFSDYYIIKILENIIEQTIQEKDVFLTKSEIEKLKK